MTANILRAGIAAETSTPSVSTTSNWGPPPATRGGRILVFVPLHIVITRSQPMKPKRSTVHL
jgi:hypothetical protein